MSTLKPFNMISNLEVYKHNKDAIIPKRNLEADAGIDLFADKDILLPLNKTTIITTGVAIHIPYGWVGLLKDRSSLAAKGLLVGGGVIDAGFNGPISILMHNLSNSSSDKIGYPLGYEIKRGDKVAQLLIQKVALWGVAEVEKLWNSDRGDSGLGSSGR
jgi:dUTP pyrophosphatase